MKCFLFYKVNFKAFKKPVNKWNSPIGHFQSWAHQSESNFKLGNISTMHILIIVYILLNKIWNDLYQIFMSKQLAMSYYFTNVIDWTICLDYFWKVILVSKSVNALTISQWQKLVLPFLFVIIIWPIFLFWLDQSTVYSLMI